MTFYMTPNERVNDNGPVCVSMGAGPRRVRGAETPRHRGKRKPDLWGLHRERWSIPSS